MLRFSPPGRFGLFVAILAVGCQQQPPRGSELPDSIISKLPPRSQSLLALRYERSLKLGEIAREVGSTLDAVHKLLSRIRENLQECLQRRLQSDQQ